VYAVERIERGPMPWQHREWSARRCDPRTDKRDGVLFRKTGQYRGGVRQPRLRIDKPEDLYSSAADKHR